ncbi:hypothetical protein BDA99DRAFT_531823 [Phascolomyces articulosus]|uniref:GIT Spa2 homology (SHD) domain-containing protein n=1 Tax=Phascolomyces articulosus TaxID=60185 RepID=A0AAD5KA89_9FUNG|nr:hypothetical protein BDA99DRAFT_531823 [Phascolomyces articulosus]
MAYSRSPPRSPSSHDDWDSRGPKPLTKAFSTSSSRSGGGGHGRTHSVTSQSSRATGGSSANNASYETAARTYYGELKKFLTSVLAKEAAEGAQPQRVSARQKLSRLNNLQFHELAMDVYDELMRRNLNDKQVGYVNIVPFLAVREEFHPRRNQARQKLATLPSARFKDLASDVYHELTRRYPQVADSDDVMRPPVPPIPTNSGATAPQASRATNIVPVKGTINVEAVALSDDEKAYMAQRDGSNDERQTYLSDSGGSNSTGSSAGGGASGYQPKSGGAPQTNGHLSSGSNGSEGNFQSLDSLMADLGNMVTTKGPSATDGADIDDTRMNEKMEKMRADYEHKLASMSKRTQQLENELLNARERKGSLKSDDQDMNHLRKMDNSRLKQLQEEYNRLDDRYRQLEQEHRDQQDAVREVRDEAGHLLEQIKLLSSKNDDLRAEKSRCDDRIRQLTDEVQEWQSKCEKNRLELRTLKEVFNDKPFMVTPFKLLLLASSLIDSAIPQQTGFIQPTRNGAISHDHILTYQTSIDELLQKARSHKPSDVLSSMQKIVMTCKKVTEEVEQHETRGGLSSIAQTSLYSLKSQFSTALTHLLTAAKNHANGMGISPVSLLDAAAGHMTTVMVDLAKLLGIKPSSESSSGDSGIGGMVSMDSNRNDTLNALSGGGSLRRKDSANDKSNNRIAAAAAAGDALLPEELSEYLKSETDHIVQTIQRLLAALRSPREASQVYGIITSLINIVASIMEVCDSTFGSTAGYRYRKQGTLVMTDLQHCKQTLTHMRDTSFDQSPEMASSTAKRDLAKEAYEIAKYTKELINILDS